MLLFVFLKKLGWEQKTKKKKKIDFLFPKVYVFRQNEKQGTEIIARQLCFQKLEIENKKPGIGMLPNEKQETRTVLTSP